MDCKSAGECVSRRDGGCAGPPSENLKDLARAHTFVNLIHIAGNVLLTGERRELEGKAVFFFFVFFTLNSTLDANYSLRKAVSTTFSVIIFSHCYN